jgi:excisionase family DNA binding protein
VNGAAEAPQMDAALYLTIEQAAQLVVVDPKTLARWAREDTTLPVLRRGRVVRLPKTDFLNWLEKQTRRLRAPRGAPKAQHAASAA